MLTRIPRRLFSTQSLIDQARKQAEIFGLDPAHAYDPSLPVEAFQSAIGAVHSSSFDLSWASSCVAVAGIFRAATLPLYSQSIVKGRRRAEAAKELVDLRDMAKEAVLLRDQKLVQDIDREYKTRLAGYGLTGSPVEGFGYLFLCQLPFVTTMLFSIRGMSTQPELFKSFITESGIGWIPSLALPDPYGILPLISTSIVALASSRQGSGDVSKSISARDQQYIQYAIRGACFTFLPFAMQLPAGMILFFIFNSIFNRLATPLIHQYRYKLLDRKPLE
jgi:membrane protein insertase Oxa1/YidC/SpoIIIJ